MFVCIKTTHDKNGVFDNNLARKEVRPDSNSEGLSAVFSLARTAFPYWILPVWLPSGAPEVRLQQNNCTVRVLAASRLKRIWFPSPAGATCLFRVVLKSSILLLFQNQRSGVPYLSR